MTRKYTFKTHTKEFSTKTVDTYKKKKVKPPITLPPIPEKYLDREHSGEAKTLTDFIIPDSIAEQWMEEQPEIKDIPWYKWLHKKKVDN